MNKLRGLYKGAIQLCSLAMILNSGGVLAQTVAPAQSEGSVAQPQCFDNGLCEIVVIGSRQSGQKAADSPAPVQILSPEALAAASGSSNLMSTLAQIVPSLTMQAFGADLAGDTLQAKLRGLSPNQVLVLIDGKRRHTTANIAIDASPYQGGAGVDLNFIPLDAIDHIEVLTDGAAAQYGTDAMAGVINIILKKKSSGGSLGASYGQYGNAGGKNPDVGANGGFGPTDGGFFNVTGEVRIHGHSNVGAIDERVVNPAKLTSYPNSNLPNVPGYPYVNRIRGDGEYQTQLLLVNTGVDFEGGTELYSTLTYGHKHAASYENYRLPNQADYVDKVNVIGQTVIPFPFGFSPQEATAEDDYQFNLGIKGSIASWNWDLTTGFGGDKVAISTIGSYNTGYASLNGVPTPTNFYDGYLKTTQWTTTADFNRDFNAGMAGPLNVAFGAEFRRETYAIGPGVPLSYLAGGASGYAGFTPSDVSDNGRQDTAGYVDFAAKPIDGLRIDVAGRFEHYSDFGNATVGKFTGRYDFSPEFAIRGTISNGFRAPTLAEEYYTSTAVNVTRTTVQLAPNSAGGKLLGLGNGLQPEKSIDFSLGFVWRPTPGMNATLDLYRIRITNRIVNSGNIIGSKGGTIVSPEVNAAIIASGNQLDPSIVATGTTGISVFANGIDTQTRGADLVFDFPVDYGFGKIDWSIGATYNDTTITKYATTPAALAAIQANGIPKNELYDPQAYSNLTTASPKYVLNLGASLTTGKLSVNLAEKIYGPSSAYQNDDGDNGGTTAGAVPACVPRAGTLFICPGGRDYFQSKIGVTPITNLDISYQLVERLKLSIGALNLFNKFPPLINPTQLAHENSIAYGDNQGVEQYPAFSPFGINGGFYYLKALYKF